MPLCGLGCRDNFAYHLIGQVRALIPGFDTVMGVLSIDVLMAMLPLGPVFSSC